MTPEEYIASKSVTCCVGFVSEKDALEAVRMVRRDMKQLQRLADAMYSAAQYLTTDASRLHKAME